MHSCSILVDSKQSAAFYKTRILPKLQFKKIKNFAIFASNNNG